MFIKIDLYMNHCIIFLYLTELREIFKPKRTKMNWHIQKMRILEKKNQVHSTLWDQTVSPCLKNNDNLKTWVSKCKLFLSNAAILDELFYKFIYLLSEWKLTGVNHIEFNNCFLKVALGVCFALKFMERRLTSFHIFNYLR